MYSTLRTFRINRIIAARTKFSIEWSHYGPDGVFDVETHGRLMVPRYPVLRAKFCCVIYIVASYK